MASVQNGWSVLMGYKDQQIDTIKHLDDREREKEWLNAYEKGQSECITA